MEKTVGVVLSPALQAYFDTNPQNFKFFDIIEAQFETVTVRTAFAPFDIDWNGHTYHGTGPFVSLSEVRETSEHTIEGINIEAAAIPRYDGDTNLLAEVLNENFINKPVVVSRLFMDPNSWMDVYGERVIFDGFIQKASILDEDKTKDDAKFVIQFQVASFFSDFNRTNGRKTDDGSHQALFPGDRFFQTASKVAKEIQWKKPS